MWGRVCIRVWKPEVNVEYIQHRFILFCCCSFCFLETGCLFEPGVIYYAGLAGSKPQGFSCPQLHGTGIADEYSAPIIYFLLGAGVQAQVPRIAWQALYSPIHLSSLTMVHCSFSSLADGTGVCQLELKPFSHEKQCEYNTQTGGYSLYRLHGN